MTTTSARLASLESAFLRALGRSAKSSLRAKGWSLRTAAPLLHVHFSHLHHVLTGARRSSALLSRIERLPVRNATDNRTNLQIH